jgi:hypothetical protein
VGEAVCNERLTGLDPKLLTLLNMGKATLKGASVLAGSAFVPALRVCRSGVRPGNRAKTWAPMALPQRILTADAGRKFATICVSDAQQGISLYTLQKAIVEHGHSVVRESYAVEGICL